jgi:hypothetical protein
MKGFLKLILTFLVAGSLFSCKKNVDMVTYEDGTPPVLSANKTTIPLSFANASQEAVKLSWTNPNYRFSTGVNSQDVAYLLEIDTTGANFTNPNRKAIGLSRDLSITFTQETLNDYLLNQLALKAGVPHNIEFRVTSSLTNNSLALPSNVLKFTVTPYAIPPKVVPPASGKLYITGSATQGNWMAGGDAELMTQKFTQVSPTLYVLNSVALNGGGSYLFVPVYGDWGAKYGYVGSNNQNNVNGDDFKVNGGDMLAPTASGNYKIEVDFQRGKFTLTKL